MTLEAIVRFKPTPPALVEISITEMLSAMALALVHGTAVPNVLDAVNIEEVAKKIEEGDELRKDDDLDRLVLGNVTLNELPVGC
jgi:hypothetical protein